MVFGFGVCSGGPRSAGTVCVARGPYPHRVRPGELGSGSGVRGASCGSGTVPVVIRSGPRRVPCARTPQVYRRVWCLVVESSLSRPLSRIHERDDSTHTRFRLSTFVWSTRSVRVRERVANVNRYIHLCHGRWLKAQFIPNDVAFRREGGRGTHPYYTLVAKRESQGEWCLWLILSLVRPDLVVPWAEVVCRTCGVRRGPFRGSIGRRSVLEEKRTGGPLSSSCSSLSVPGDPLPRYGDWVSGKVTGTRSFAPVRGLDHGKSPCGPGWRVFLARRGSFVPVREFDHRVVSFWRPQWAGTPLHLPRYGDLGFGGFLLIWGCLDTKCRCQDQDIAFCANFNGGSETENRWNCDLGVDREQCGGDLDRAHRQQDTGERHYS